jgi:hypothetical protein
LKIAVNYTIHCAFKTLHMALELKVEI